MIDVNPWVLALEFDERGRARVEGVPLTPSGSLNVFVSGIVYDRADWIRDLALTGEITNAELVGAAIVRHGFEVMSRMRGSFAIAAIDESSCRIVPEAAFLGFAKPSSPRSVIERFSVWKSSRRM